MKERKPTLQILLLGLWFVIIPLFAVRVSRIMVLEDGESIAIVLPTICLEIGIILYILDLLGAFKKG